MFREKEEKEKFSPLIAELYSRGKEALRYIRSVKLVVRICCFEFATNFLPWKKERKKGRKEGGKENTRFLSNAAPKARDEIGPRSTFSLPT